MSAIEAATAVEVLTEFRGTDLNDLCDAAEAAIADGGGFGWVKSRAEVAGFQAHFFRKVPTTERWQIRAVELVGLLLHKEPVAYVTANLPRP